LLPAADIDSSALQKDAALVVSAVGQVSTEKKGQDWAIGSAEHIWVTKPIVTGADGYARFQVAGGTSFEVFAHSRVIFRENPGNPQDLLDVTTGRVRVQVQPSAGPAQTRILTPAAIISSHGTASFAIAVDDEDNSTRIDVQQGEVSVQHALIPRSEPVIVKAGDAIAVRADAPLISRRLDRGSLYHYAFQRIWKTLGSAVPGHSGKGGKEGEAETQLLASSRLHFCGL
jgi:ferric-dicitrate binding protein FerR (iron transport regulator)